MQQKDIKDGETYLFVATDSPTRKHLEGTPFTVQYHKAVFRRFKGTGTRKRLRYFNDDGVGARASELEQLTDEDKAAMEAGCDMCPLCRKWKPPEYFEKDEPGCLECRETIPF